MNVSSTCVSNDNAVCGKWSALILPATKYRSLPFCRCQVCHPHQQYAYTLFPLDQYWQLLLLGVRTRESWDDLKFPWLSVQCLAKYVTLRTWWVADSQIPQIMLHLRQNHRLSPVDHLPLLCFLTFRPLALLSVDTSVLSPCFFACTADEILHLCSSFLAHSAK